MYYNGSGWELRKEIGTSDIFTTPNEMLPKKYRVSDAELWRIISRPATFATFNNSLQMKTNRIGYMKRISTAMAKVIELLEAEKK